MKFWYSCIGSSKGYSLRPLPDTPTVIFSDASDVAFGGILSSLDGIAATGMLPSDDLGQSTFRGLKAKCYELLSYADYLTHKSVKCFTGSQSGPE